MDREQVTQRAQQFIDALHALEAGSADNGDQLVDLFSDDSRVINSALKLSGEERTGRDHAREF